MVANTETTSGQGVESESWIGCLHLESFLLGLWELRGREVERNIGRASRDWKTPRKTRPSGHNRTDIHMNSQRLWHHTHGLYRSKPDGVPSTEREMDTSYHPWPSIWFPSEGSGNDEEEAAGRLLRVWGSEGNSVIQSHHRDWESMQRVCTGPNRQGPSTKMGCGQEFPSPAKN